MIEKKLLKRLDQLREYDKTEKEKVAEHNLRKLHQYKQWSREIEVYLNCTLKYEEILNEGTNSNKKKNQS